MLYSTYSMYLRYPSMIWYDLFANKTQTHPETYKKNTHSRYIRQGWKTALTAAFDDSKFKDPCCHCLWSYDLTAYRNACIVVIIISIVITNSTRARHATPADKHLLSSPLFVSLLLTPQTKPQRQPHPRSISRDTFSMLSLIWFLPEIDRSTDGRTLVAL